MTYKEYLKRKEALDSKKKLLIVQGEQLDERYIRDNLPFEFKKYMNVTVRLRVPQETKRYQLGHVYEKTGSCVGFFIGLKGELRPVFWGMSNSYPFTDEVLSLEVASKQPEGDCRNCKLYEDGYCSRFGTGLIALVRGKHKVEDGQYTCPRYEPVNTSEK